MFEPVANRGARNLKVVVHLQSKPEFRRHGEEACKPQGRIGGDRALAANDPGDAVARNPDPLGERIGADPKRLQKLLGRISPGWIGPTGFASGSMISW